jgi:hypothetical protein
MSCRHAEPCFALCAKRRARVLGFRAYLSRARHIGIFRWVAAAILAGCAKEQIELAPLNDTSLAERPASALAQGCGKIDFLFVVDNSMSMQEEQDNLARSFPGLLDVVDGTLRPRDYQLLITDTDASRGQSGLAGVIGQDYSCQPAPACCRAGCDSFVIPFINVPLVDTCNGLSCKDVTSASPEPECEGELGAGKRYAATGAACGIDGERRYMVTGQAGLAETFACAARVGTFGAGDEQPMAAMMRAVSPALNGAGGCNAGFVRPDAVLVVTFITDEDDDASPGDPELWRRALLDAKDQNEGAVVLLGLMGSAECGQPAPRLESMLQSLRFGFSGSVCAADYTPFFSAALEVIDAACADFVPVIR